ncbi:Hypothetical predicted protein, partial [Mytilus galloprovincialis]
LKPAEFELLTVFITAMSVTLGVFLLPLYILVKRKMKNKNEILTLQRKLVEIEGLRLNIEIEKLTIKKRRLENEENSIQVITKKIKPHYDVLHEKKISVTDTRLLLTSRI